MNKKLTVKTENGDLRYCILSADEDIAVQVGRFLHADGSAGAVHVLGWERTADQRLLPRGAFRLF